MVNALLYILLVTPLLMQGAEEGHPCVGYALMCTRWTASARAETAYKNYPRPQMKRQSWQSLNGPWKYAITGADATKPTHYDGTIQVPYPVESLLSGVRKPLRPNQLLWYARTFSSRGLSKGHRLLLHFGAVDFSAAVYVNDIQVGKHAGGYQDFTLDITSVVRAATNDLLVKVSDPTDTGINPYGKQTLSPDDTVYTSSSGIWQTVWLEVVPESFIESVLITPYVKRSEVELSVKVNATSAADYVEAIVENEHRRVISGHVSGTTSLKIERPHLWTPDDPFLYGLKVRLWKSGKVVDEVESYFGMRSVEIKTDAAGIPRIFLNGRYTYNLGVLDQGFWPDGLYTAPTDAALKFDVLATKAMGFNTIRKHIKIEPERWYYYCDKFGMLIWQDMVPPGNRTPQARTEFEREVKEDLEQLHNHPSIVTWVLFNEGWESFDQERLAKWIKALDPSRLVDAHSGPNVTHIAEWSREQEGAQLLALIDGDDSEGFHATGLDHPADWIGGDIVDIHSYPDPLLPPPVEGKVRVIGEYGGIRLPVDGHVWNGIPAHGRKVVNDVAEFAAQYKRLMVNLKTLEARGVSASIYTQPFDVEIEQNGLITYDRAMIKIPLEEIANINKSIVAGTVTNAHAMHALAIQDVDATPLSQRFQTLKKKFKQGDRRQIFLKRLTFLALELGDQAQATEAGNQFLEQTPQPYSADVWRFIQAVTRTSHDRGFGLLRSQTEHADEVLGKKNAAETVIRTVIAREEITPYVSNAEAVNWHNLEETMSRKYGLLGTEEVYGAEMLYSIGKADWSNFGKYFESYFATASERSEYSLGILSFLMFKHVVDVQALESAIAACNPQVDILLVCGLVDPPGVDTYANLLYKVGRTSEALEWEERAAQLANGESTVINDHLSKMRAGQPTWTTSP